MARKDQKDDLARFGAAAVIEVVATPPGLTPQQSAMVVGGKLYGVGRRVVKWFEPEGFNGYITEKVRILEEDRKTGAVTERVIDGPRFAKRRGKVASQIVIHHSGGDGPTPEQMYHTLWYERGLSVQFGCEDTGLLYQFLDAEEVAWQAGLANGTSVGVEAALFPERDRKPDYYHNAERRGNVPHAWTKQTLQGVTRSVFTMPAPQVAALVDLCTAFWAIQELRYEGVSSAPFCFREPPKFPRIKGEIPYGVVDGALNHVGLLGHLHLTKNKWDPAGLDLAAFEEAVAQRWARRWSESKGRT